MVESIDRATANVLDVPVGIPKVRTFGSKANKIVAARLVGRLAR
jgi:hypothetical protein